MTKVKICGLTRMEDAAWANALKPDYVGFVFAESRRRVTPETAARIAERIDHAVKRVGVFVNPSMDDIRQAIAVCPLDILQLHGEESPAFCEETGMPIWKAFRMRGPEVLERLDAYRVDAYVLDGHHPCSYGGTQVPFPWEWAEHFDFNGKPVVLAGGLTADNVTEALHRVRPWAVDVSSGVETDGVKNAGKIAAFIERVRRYD